MGGGRSAISFLVLALLLSMPLSSAACIPGGTVPNYQSCNGDPATCCSGFCSSADGMCGACVEPGDSGCHASADCCSGNVCLSGTCNSCLCDDKTQCGNICDTSLGGADCCSGICGSNGLCAACIPSGESCSSKPGSCCGGLACTSGVCGGPAATTGSTDWSSGVFAWTALAVIMAAAFLGLAYMASRLFELQVLEAWVRIELGELVKSMIIAVFCIALIASTNAAAAFLSGSPTSTDMISASQASLKVMYVDAQALYMKLSVAYFNLSKVASYSYMAGTSAAGYFTISYNSAPGAGLSPLVSEMGQALDAVAAYMLLAATQAAFLRFFGTASVVMLPLGIFLRSFSLTRRLGGTLLAATIGAVVIFPSSVLLSGEVYKTFQPDIQASTANVVVKDAENPPLASVVCSEYMKMFVQSPIPLVGGEIGWWLIICTPVCAIVAAASTVGYAAAFTACFAVTCKDVINLVFMIIKSVFPIILWAIVFADLETATRQGALIDNYYKPILNYGMPAVAKFTVLSLVTFLIPIIITLSLLRALSSAFGGEVQLYGLSKLV